MCANLTVIVKKALTVVGMFGVMTVGAAQGAVIFSDNFNTSVAGIDNSGQGGGTGSAYDVNRTYNNGTRQGGSIAPLMYTQTPAPYTVGASPWLHQLDFSDGIYGTGTLRMIAFSGVGVGRVGPNHNFDTYSALGGYFSVKFDFATMTSTTGSGWFGMRLGSTLAPGTASSVLLSGDGGFGFLFRQNGTVGYFNESGGAFAGTSFSNPLTVFSPYSASSTFHAFELRFTDLIDGNPFNGSVNNVTVDGYVDNSLVFSYTRTGNFTDNNITFLSAVEAPSLGGAYIDNLVIETVTPLTVIPEPASMALMILGSSVVAARRRIA